MLQSARISILLSFLSVFFCALTAHAADEADVIYFGGEIITLSESAPSAEALAVKDGKIQAIGSKISLEKMVKGPHTRLIDLKGKTLLPGFMDAHSHYFSALSVANQVMVYAPPAGPGKDVDSIISTIEKFRRQNKIKKGELIQAYGYDDTLMPNGRLLNRGDLDRAFPENPVLVGHVSMHGAVLNSLALKRWNIDASTKTPPGGVIVRKPGTEEPWGLIMEMAYFPIFASLPKPSAEQEVEWTKAAQKIYAAAGITTAHEGATHPDEVEVMQRAAAKGANLIDVIAFPFITEVDAVLKSNPRETWGIYQNRLKLGGIKITIDGSPQGKTAYFSSPYLTDGPSGEKNWRGELSFPEATIQSMVKKVYDLGLPLNLHANGDAAIDTFLKAHELAAANDLSKDRHVTVIHSQFVRPDQLDLYVKYKITPSFYTLHTYYFADAHMKNRGRDQASYISPMTDALRRNLRPTNHTDYVVVPLDQMFMMWSAVNRIARSGDIVGPGQRVAPLDALKAMTIHVAYQYGEESMKGSLETGKLADMVILSKNPLKVDPMKIKDIKVLATIKEGRTIFDCYRGQGVTQQCPGVAENTLKPGSKRQ